MRHGFNSRIPLSSADVAQLVEQCFRKAKVVGSIPTIGSIVYNSTMPTRLERHASKQLHSRIITFVIILALIVIFLVTIGLPLLINASVAIGKMFSKNTDQENNAQALGDFSVNEIPSATNSASINVSGNVENLSELEIYLNGDKEDTLDLSDQQDFSTTITGLHSGENQIYFLAKVKNSTATKKSDSYTVIYANQKPKLEISEPSENLITPRDEIKVAGKTDQNISVTVNDSPVTVDASGSFQTNVKLKEGENKIKIVVSDQAGNSDSKELTVKYEK